MITTVLRRARRGLSPVSQRVRRFAGGGGPHPEYTGFEKKLRDVFPEQHQLVMFYLGCWAGLFVLYKLIPKSKSKPTPVEDAVVSSAGTSSTDIPSITSPDFEAWSKIKGNMKKWEDSLEPWAVSLN